MASIKNFYNPEPVNFKDDYKVFLEQQDNNWKKIEESDRKAKEAGKVEGRYVTFPVADGQAVYIVTRYGQRTCTLEVCKGIGDDWTYQVIGKKGSLSTQLVLKIIKSREAIDKLFKN